MSNFIQLDKNCMRLRLFATVKARVRKRSNLIILLVITQFTLDVAGKQLRKLELP